MDIGKTARDARESLGLSQRAAARKLEISVVHLCNIEKNKSAPSLDLISRCETVYGVNIYVMAWFRHKEHLSVRVRDAEKKGGQ